MKSTNYLNEIYELLNSGNIELAFTLAKSILNLNEIELIEWLWVLLAKEDGDIFSKYLKLNNVILEYDVYSNDPSNWWCYNYSETLLFDEKTLLML